MLAIWPVHFIDKNDVRVSGFFWHEDNCPVAQRTGIDDLLVSEYRLIGPAPRDEEARFSPLL